jgi:hypothetical protein
MNILFVVDALQDLVSDPLYLGLVRVLGQEKVVDFPSKSIFHDPESKRWFLPQVPALNYSEERIRDLLRDRYFDLVCLASAREQCVANLRRIYTQNGFPPIVFIDGADDARIRHDVVREFSVALYFKREYAWSAESAAVQWWNCVKAFRGSRSLYDRTYPLQISIPQDALPARLNEQKDIDVSFYGYASHRKRPQAMELIRSLGREGLAVAAGIYGSATDKQYKLEPTRFRRTVTKLFNPVPVSEEGQRRKLSPDEYYRTIARSKVAVSIRGGGFDTLRYWEIVATGTFMLSEQPDIVIPDNFQHGQHAVFCRPNLKDFKELVRYYVRHDAERETIARAGHEHLLKHHTCERRAEYFLDICAKNI